MVQFRAIWFGLVWFGASYVNLRQPHIFAVPNLKEKLILHSSKYGISTQKRSNMKQTAYQISLVPQNIKLISRGAFLCT